MSIRQKILAAQTAWNLVVQTNQRSDLVNVILGIELQIIEALRLEAVTEIIHPPLPHLHD